jgi:spoIIIJ-associated protein
MINGREFYGATVEEAVDRAVVALGVERDQLDFEVVDSGSAGFLGIGARDARIVVERSEARMRPPDLGGDASVSEAGEGSQDLPDEEGGQVLPEDELAAVSRSEGDLVGASADTPYELILAADQFMTNLLEAMGLDGTVDAHDAGDAISVNVSVKETGLFIGQKGETIDAVQLLLNVAVFKERPFLKRFVVDCEGYRRRRVEAIQGMAHRLSRRALKEKRPLSLPPMPAAERRVVHLFLKENPRVTTHSDGEDDNRRVVISPA